MTSKGGNMNQHAIGQLLKELRKEKGITQEKLAEMLNVSNRSISRWENGNTLPDFDLLIELANYYDISIDEILGGKRRGEEVMEKETLEKVAEYTNEEKLRLLNTIKYVAWLGVVMWSLFFLLKYLNLDNTDYAGYIAGIALGITISIALVTTFQMRKLKEFKRKVLKIG